MSLPTLSVSGRAMALVRDR